MVCGRRVCVGRAPHPPRAVHAFPHLEKALVQVPGLSSVRADTTQHFDDQEAELGALYSCAPIFYAI